MDADLFNRLRQFERAELHTLWKMANLGALDGLDAEKQTLARIMLAHADEYGADFECADADFDYDYRAVGQTNPFLHVTFHAIVENQLAARDPIEVYQFYNAMRRHKASHHDTLHLIARILIPFLMAMMKTAQAFDTSGYIAQLKRLKLKRPETIWKLLDAADDVATSEVAGGEVAAGEADADDAGA